MNAHISNDGALWKLRYYNLLMGSFHLVPVPDSSSVLRQNTYPAPRGLLGLVYRYSLLPIHTLVFNGMAKRLSSKAESAGK